MGKGIEVLKEACLFAFDDGVVFGFVPGIDDGFGGVALPDVLDDLGEGDFSFADDNVIDEIIGDDHLRNGGDMDAAEDNLRPGADLFTDCSVMQRYPVVKGRHGEGD